MNQEFLSNIKQLAYSPWIQASFVFSLLLFIGSLFFIPYIILKLPANFFKTENRPPVLFLQFGKNTHLFFKIIKNIIGFILLLSGFIMLFLPGQGLITIFLGLGMMDFPGKNQLIKKFIGVPSVLNKLNHFRVNRGLPPFEVES